MKKDSYRDALVIVLGGRCSCDHSDCWHNGHCRVSDKRCLQIDHINGDGNTDRRRFGSDEAMFRHYLEHFGEEGHRVQLLCANCNWVKRLWNKEVRQPYRSELPRQIEDSSNYKSLLELFRSVVTSIVGANELTLLGELRHCGLDETAKHPLSYYLSLNWSHQDFYGCSSDDLVAFLVEKVSMAKSVFERLAVRTGQGRSDTKSDYTITKVPPITRL